MRIPDEVFENRCRWCRHRTEGVEENRDVEKWELHSFNTQVHDSLPCRIMSLSRYDRVPGECLNFAPNLIYGICHTCQHDNCFTDGYCMMAEQPGKHQVYIGNDHFNEYYRVHSLSTCDNYSPSGTWIPHMILEAAQGKIPKNFDPETMKPIRAEEREESEEKWAEIQADHERSEEIVRREKERALMEAEAKAAGQVPGQVSMDELFV